MESVYVIQPVFDGRAEHLCREAVALIESAGACCVGAMFVKIREIDPYAYLGEGKIAELRERLHDTDATVLFNGELSPSQTSNLAAALEGKKVIDRVALILDIFAQRAVSSEGKLQVELAQLKYLYPRLKGKGAALSRLGGGIGTRGPGESQLETDRRHIRARIGSLEERLRTTERRRALQVTRRIKDRVRTIALVGYTNTGKSTLLNALTGADTLTKDALFATLDPTARRMEIDGLPFLLVDTVGFLQDLPHHLIKAFRSTLESALRCDLALFVCDVTDDYERQLQTTRTTLEEMGFSSPYLVVLNKCDGLDSAAGLPHDAVCISAKNKTGLDALKRRILEELREEYRRVTLFVPYARAAEYASLRACLSECSVTYDGDGAHITAVIPVEHAEKFQPFIQ